MRIYNTMTRKLEELTPLEPGHVRMYTCGPTVYNYAHIGNFRAYLFEDILRRHIKYSGYEITQVMNLTDVDDKTIRGANEAGVSLDDYTQPFKDSFFEDLAKLNAEPAEHYPAATDHVPEMITLIEKLIEAGHAYVSDDGSVYYRVSSFPRYGCLAHLDMSGMRTGDRVAHDEYDKDSVADFALWKTWDEADGTVAWDSPWGRGRPGWHIECSAMSMKYLGESFDLHTGGMDNMFPHHENEIAQSEGATGHSFVRFWMHCGWLVVDGAKMSKSLGNFYTLREILDKGYSGREVRYVLMAAHYRQPLNFTFSALDAARATLKRLDAFADRLREQAGLQAADAASVPAWAASARECFRKSLDDDLNMPEALAAVFDMVHEGNRAQDNGDLDPSAAASALDVLLDMDRVLGVIAAPAEDKPDEEVLQLVEQRQAARQDRDYAKSDALRDQIAALGWVVKDTPDGPKLTRG